VSLASIDAGARLARFGKGGHDAPLLMPRHAGLVP
jgi:hypothetical protein